MADQDFLTDTPSGDPPAHSPSEFPSHGRRADRTTLKVSQSRGFTLREVLRLLFKHKWLLILPFLIIPPIGYLYAQTLTPVYFASARLQIQATEFTELLPDAASGETASRSLLNDQILLLLSDVMLEDLIEKLHLDDLMPIQGAQEMERSEKITALILQLRGNILSVRAIPRTRSIRITAQWPENKDMPAMIANELAILYVERVSGQIEEAADTFRDAYDLQSEATLEELDTINGQIEEFLRENSVASVEWRMQSLNDELSRVRRTLWNYENEVISLDVEIESIQNQLDAANPEISTATSTVPNPEFGQAERYLDALMVRRLNELARWKPDSPRIQNLDKQIEEAEQRLLEIDPQIAVEGAMAVNPAYRDLKAILPKLRILRESTMRKITALQDEEKELNEEILSFGQVRQRYERLKTDKDILMERLRSERDRMSVAQNQKVFVDQITDVRVADPARRPLAPSPTRKNMILLMSLAASFGLGIGLAGVREIMNQTMETSDDVHKHLHLPVLGVIPDKVLR